MKRIFFIAAVFLVFSGCRNQEEKEQIHLGDYDHQDSTETGIMPKGPEISADSTEKGMMETDSTKMDSTKIYLRSNQGATE